MASQTDVYVSVRGVTDGNSILRIIGVVCVTVAVATGCSKRHDQQRAAEIYASGYIKDVTIAFQVGMENYEVVHPDAIDFPQLNSLSLVELFLIAIEGDAWSATPNEQIDLSRALLFRPGSGDSMSHDLAFVDDIGAWRSHLSGEATFNGIIARMDLPGSECIAVHAGGHTERMHDDDFIDVELISIEETWNEIHDLRAVLSSD